MVCTTPSIVLGESLTDILTPLCHIGVGYEVVLLEDSPPRLIDGVGDTNMN